MEPSLQAEQRRLRHESAVLVAPQHTAHSSLGHTGLLPYISPLPPLYIPPCLSCERAAQLLTRYHTYYLLLTTQAEAAIQTANAIMQLLSVGTMATQLDLIVRLLR